jgi:hypothetical protein
MEGQVSSWGRQAVDGKLGPSGFDKRCSLIAGDLQAVGKSIGDLARGAADVALDLADGHD